MALQPFSKTLLTAAWYIATLSMANASTLSCHYNKFMIPMAGVFADINKYTSIELHELPNTLYEIIIDVPGRAKAIGWKTAL
ncbi:MAG: hypothetical protein ACREDP_23840, partial [Bradyrhizobium sp.]